MKKEKSIYKGQIENFHTEVVEKILYYQEEQGNERDVEVFENNKKASYEDGGFCWRRTYEGYLFWEKVIEYKNFDLFFKAYPKETHTVKNHNTTTNKDNSIDWEQRQFELFKEIIGLKYNELGPMAFSESYVFQSFYEARDIVKTLKKHLI